MKAVFFRELRAHLRSPLGLIFLALSLFASGILLTAYNLTLGYEGLGSVLTYLILCMILLLPILGLRFFGNRAGEGDAFLYSLPVSRGGIVVGKYLAALTMVTVPTAVVALYPLILAAVATVSAPAAYGQLLGYFLCTVTLLSLVFFLYAVCKRRTVALILSYVLPIAWLFLGSLAGLLPLPWLAKLIRDLSIFYCMDRFVFGLLDLGAVVLYLSLSALFLLLAVLISGKRAGERGKLAADRRTRMGATLLAAAILVCNLPFFLLPDTAAQIPMKEVYTLSDSTERYLKELDQDVTLYRLDGGSSDTVYEIFLERLCALSPHLTLREIDIDKDTDFLAAHGLSAENVLPNSLVVESGLRYRYLSYDSLFTYSNDYFSWDNISHSQYYAYEYQWTYYYRLYASNSSYSDQASTYSSYLFSLYYNTETNFNGDTRIVSTVEYVTREQIPTFYYLSGHGELSLGDTVLDDKCLSLYESPLEELTLNGEVPANAAALIINRPTSDLTASELEAILRYTDGGGRLLLLTDSAFLSLENFARLPGAYGMSAVEGPVTVTETDEEAGASKETEWVTATPNVHHDGLAAYENVSETYLPHWMEGDSIRLAEDSEALLTALVTSPAASYLPADPETPASHILGASAEQSNGMRFLWLTGARTFNEDNYLDSNNASLMTYLVSWCGDFFESSLPVAEPVLYSLPNLSTTLTNVAVIGIVLIGLVPLGVLAFGFTVRYRRRRRQPELSE